MRRVSASGRQVWKHGLSVRARSTQLHDGQRRVQWFPEPVPAFSQAEWRYRLIGVDGQGSPKSLQRGLEQLIHEEGLLLPRFHRAVPASRIRALRRDSPSPDLSALPPRRRKSGPIGSRSMPAPRLRSPGLPLHFGSRTRRSLLQVRRCLPLRPRRNRHRVAPGLSATGKPASRAGWRTRRSR